MRGKKTETETVDAGSGDVLVDLGFPDADERKLRVQLAMRLNELIAACRLTQTRAAQLFGIPQPHISELKHYKLSRFSSERLVRFVTPSSIATSRSSSGRRLRGMLRESCRCWSPELSTRASGDRRPGGGESAADRSAGRRGSGGGGGCRASLPARRPAAAVQPGTTLQLDS
jgi:predicted XRE-type DNA-binding protein